MNTPYTLTHSDISKASIVAFGQHWRTCDFIGRILPGDVGKRVYRVMDASGGYFLQVENDSQRAKREGVK